MPADESQSATHASLMVRLNRQRLVFSCTMTRDWLGDQPPRRALLSLPKRHRLFEELTQIVAFSGTRCEMPNLLRQGPFD